MPQSLGPIPAGVPIVDKDGAITDFFRLRWEDLRKAAQTVGTIAALLATGLTASVVTTAAYTTKVAGVYRISYYIRKTAADGVSSSLTFTWGWTESGVPVTVAAAALTLDTTAAAQSGSMVVAADAAVDLTYAIAYASNTPGLMAFRYNVVVEQLS